jgi:6-phosphogluconolactonase/glucosamine-6-phosphate isomerase/deaminase
MLKEDLFSLIELDDNQIEFFNGMAENLQDECERIDQFILKNPITFSLMGVGMNGHIGLNEPGSAVLDHSSVIPLSETTKKVAQKYFDEPTDLSEGITLGLKQIIESSRVIVAITGEHKASMVKQLFEEPEANLPAQELLGYEHIDFYLDQAAAKALNK